MAYSVEKTNDFLDELKYLHKIKTETRFAQLIETNKVSLWRVRNGINPLSDKDLIAIHEVFDIPIKEIKERIS